MGCCDDGLESEAENNQGHSCDNKSTGMLPLATAKQRLSDAVESVQSTEKIALENALERVLATDILSAINVPGYDNSAMDGYAVKSADLEQQLTLKQVGKAFAGAPFTGEMKSGQCVRIMTGAIIPNGADSVVMQEDTQSEGDNITFSFAAKLGSNIRRAGEDISVGENILPSGRRITPTDIGLLASIGVAQLEVKRRLKVAIFSTGDELRLPEQKLDTGCIYDSNRFVVRAMLQRLDAEIVDMGIIPDDPSALRDAFITASNECDAIISSGGVSVGEADYTKDILSNLGKVGFWKVAIKPGKPFAFGKINDAFFFGLPGNPVSATITFHQLALPALRQMAGETVLEPVQVSLPSQTRIKKRPGRTDFQRGIYALDESGQLAVANTGAQGSGILQSMSKAECYIVLDAERGDAEAGEMVKVQAFDRWLN